MQNLATSAANCGYLFEVDIERYNTCLHNFLNLNEDFDGVNGGNPFANMATIASARYQNLNENEDSNLNFREICEVYAEALPGMDY